MLYVILTRNLLKAVNYIAQFQWILYKINRRLCDTDSPKGDETHIQFTIYESSFDVQREKNLTKHFFELILKIFAFHIIRKKYNFNDILKSLILYSYTFLSYLSCVLDVSQYNFLNCN